MKISHSFLVVFFLTIAFSYKLAAQNIEFDELNFPGKKKELKRVRREIETGDNILTGKVRRLKGIGRFEEALKHYIKANEINPNNALLNYKIGFSYMKTVEKYKAIPYLEKAYQINKKVKDDLPYLLGQAYQFNYEFDKAIQKYGEYQKTLNSFEKDAVGAKVEKKIMECRNGKELVRNPVNVKITNVGSNINNQYPQYSPIVNADQSIMFYTARQPNTLRHKKDQFDGKYMEDIYIAYSSDGVWLKTRHPGRPLNSKRHDAIVGVSQDGKTLLTYKVNTKDNGDIYMSRLKKDKYTRPKRLNKNINTPYHESSATLSPDGNTLYFISDREGGFGGRDIWVSKKDAKGDWGKPTNIGPVVNTSYNEEGVFMQADGKTLYFSSQGHNSMGGYDIFKTVYENGKWSPPRNLGYPINTPDDDVFFSITQDGRHGYYASGKKDGFGDLDIYEIEFLENKPAETVSFKGKVLDADTKNPVGSKVQIKDKDLDTEVLSIDTPPETGDFIASVPSTKTYLINVNSPEYIPYQETVPKGKNVNKIIYIHKITSARGYVYDAATKEPVCAALVDIKDGNTKSFVDTLRSDCKTGEYRSEAPAGKPYDILVTAPDYIPYKEAIPTDKDVNKIIYLERIKPVATSGIVYDEDTKEPVCSDIEVINNKTKLTADKLKTDCPSGKYQSKAPKGKPYQLKVTAPDYIPYSENLTPEQDVNKIVYIKKMKPLVTGNVYDEDTKEPVCSDVEVINDETKVSVDKLKTDCPSGKYQSKAPKGKPYQLKVTAPDYIPYSENISPDQEVNKIVYIKKLKSLISGNVYDEDTKEPVCAEIEIVDVTSKTTVDKLKTDCPSGKYRTNVPIGKKYELVTTAQDYVPNVESVQPTQDVNKIIYIKKIKAAIAQGKLFDVSTTKYFVLPDILYDLDKFDLKPQYQDSCNSLINTMRAFPNIVIELSSHTDTRASDAYNDKLSFNRAKSVVDYLISRGIEPDRLVAKGYGKKVPRVLDKNKYIISCNKKYKFEKGTVITDKFVYSKPEKCEQEAAHQLNRRTEVKVLREDYVPNKEKVKKQVKIDVIK